LESKGYELYLANKALQQSYNTIASAKNYTENILCSLMNITFPAVAEDRLSAGQGQPSHERG